MNSLISSPSACRYCHHYQIEGRRGGFCHQLGVPVKGRWLACSLMKPSFASQPTQKPRGIKLKQYVSEIYSYKAASKSKSTPVRTQIKAS